MTRARFRGTEALLGRSNVLGQGRRSKHARGKVWKGNRNLDSILKTKQAIRDLDKVNAVLKASSQHVLDLRRAKVVADANEEMAKTGRPKKSGDLIRALLSPHNGHATERGYSYIYESYMDEHVTDDGFNYWRVWEGGTTKKMWVTHGYWTGGAAGGGRYSPSAGRSRRDGEFRVTSAYNGRATLAKARWGSLHKGEPGYVGRARGGGLVSVHARWRLDTGAGKADGSDLSAGSNREFGWMMVIKHPYGGSNVIANNVRYDRKAGTRDLRAAIKRESKAAGIPWLGNLVK